MICEQCGLLDVDEPDRFCVDCHRAMDDAYYAVLAPAERGVERVPLALPVVSPAGSFPIVDPRR